jgi:hypothetical protein
MGFKKNIETNIYFCPSWAQIDQIITLAIESSKKKFIFVVENKDIYYFFKKFYPRSKIIFFKSPRTIFTLNLINFFYNFFFNYLEKKKIKLIFNKYSNTNVYCSDGFNLVHMAFAAKILSFRNRIHLYSNKINVDKFLKKKIGLKMILKIIYIKIFYGISCHSVCDPGNNLHFIYSNKYYNSISAKKMNNEVNILLLKKFIKKKLNFLSKIEILLLSSSDAIKDNLIDKNKLKVWINQFKKITKSKKIIFKRKFSTEKKFFNEKFFQELPTYIPASLLLDKVTIVIGYNSSILTQAANNCCKVISLLDLLKNKKFDQNLIYYKKFLTRNLVGNKKILFPKTINMFKKLI